MSSHSTSARVPQYRPHYDVIDVRPPTYLQYVTFSHFSAFTAVSLCRVAGLAEIFQFSLLLPHFTMMFHVPSDSASQSGSSSRALPHHLHFGNCSDVFCFMSSFHVPTYSNLLLLMTIRSQSIQPFFSPKSHFSDVPAAHPHCPYHHPNSNICCCHSLFTFCCHLPCFTAVKTTSVEPTFAISGVSFSSEHSCQKSVSKFYQSRP